MYSYIANTNFHYQHYDIHVYTPHLLNFAIKCLCELCALLILYIYRIYHLNLMMLEFTVDNASGVFYMYICVYICTYTSVGWALIRKFKGVAPYCVHT